jgi:IS5 family transposase
MSKISRFTKKAVQLAKNAVGERGEAAEYAVVSLHCLRVYLEKPYREALDLPSEMPQILVSIGAVLSWGKYATQIEWVWWTGHRSNSPGGNNRCLGLPLLYPD